MGGTPVPRGTFHSSRAVALALLLVSQLGSAHLDAENRGGDREVDVESSEANPFPQSQRRDKAGDCMLQRGARVNRSSAPGVAMIADDTAAAQNAAGASLSAVEVAAFARSGEHQEPAAVGDVHEEAHGTNASNDGAHDVPAGGHEGASHGEGHEHPEQSATAVAMAFVLLGLVAFVMSLFYMVNFPDEDVQRITWSVLSCTICIFSAVLLFTVVEKISKALLNEQTEIHIEKGPLFGTPIPPTLPVLLSHSVRFAIILIMFECILLATRERELLNKCVGMLGGHVVAFAAIESFGTFQQLQPFSDTPSMSFCAVAVSAFGIFGLCCAFTELRDSKKDVWVGPGWERWFENATEAENDIAGLSIGLLLSQAIKFRITGTLAPIHGAPHGKSQHEVFALFASSAALCVLIALSRQWLKNIKRRNAESRMKRFVQVLQGVVSMTSGWCFLFWGQWLFWSNVKQTVEGEKMTARMIMSLSFSFLGFFLIIVLDFLADKGHAEKETLATLTLTVALVIGLSWEACFSTAVEAVGQVWGDYGPYVDSGLSLLLCLIVVPAWAMFILTKGKELDFSENEEDAGGTQ